MRKPYNRQTPERIHKAIEEAWGAGCRAAPWHGDDRTALVRVADRAWRRMRLAARASEERPTLLARAIINACCSKENRTRQLEADYLWLAEFIVRSLERG